MTQSARFTALVLVLTFISAYAVGAQAPAKKPLGIEDHTRWRSISGREISGDGKWVTYGVALTNTAPTETKPVLHLLNLATNQDVEVANGAGGSFSADSRWFAYQVEPAAGRGGREAEAALPEAHRPRRRPRTWLNLQARRPEAPQRRPLSPAESS
ncbi:MAG: hypothetical protein IPL75_13295 [Acidobacteria bacterium]|nr:hypothetical protein [Acidobacteriota bacterium]